MVHPHDLNQTVGATTDLSVWGGGVRGEVHGGGNGHVFFIGLGFQPRVPTKRFRFRANKLFIYYVEALHEHGILRQEMLNDHIPP